MNVSSSSFALRMYTKGGISRPLHAILMQILSPAAAFQDRWPAAPLVRLHEYRDGMLSRSWYLGPGTCIYKHFGFLLRAYFLSLDYWLCDSVRIMQAPGEILRYTLQLGSRSRERLYSAGRLPTAYGLAKPYTGDCLDYYPEALHYARNQHQNVGLPESLHKDTHVSQDTLNGS